MDSNEKIKQALCAFIDKRVDQLFLKPYLGKVITKNDTSETLEVEVIGISGKPIIKWESGGLVILSGIIPEKNDDVLLLSLDGIFVIVGIISTTFPFEPVSE